jgi:hypothetical protein
MKKIIVLLAAVLLSSCMSSEEKIVHDDISMKNPVRIGVLPNGQELLRITLKSTPDSEDHFVYFAGNVTTTNEAVTKSNGKTSRTEQHVYVHINGQDIPIEEARRAIEEAERTQ